MTDNEHQMLRALVLNNDTWELLEAAWNIIVAARTDANNNGEDTEPLDTKLGQMVMFRVEQL
jgi:hypothetical protein